MTGGHWFILIDKLRLYRRSSSRPFTGRKKLLFLIYSPRVAIPKGTARITNGVRGIQKVLVLFFFSSRDGH
jgi:hypothetical protein